jgi:alpha-L-fucosidase
MTVSPPATVVSKLADTVSKNGNLFLNLSPMADGTIPEAQQTTLIEVGKWLEINGDAIYGTHNWIKFGEGGQRGSTALNVRFTVKGDNLYAIILGNWPKEQAVITSLATGQAPDGKITSITMLGNDGKLEFTQDADGLKVRLPAAAPCKYGYTLKIAGLKMNPPTATISGNPQ